MDNIISIHVGSSAMDVLPSQLKHARDTAPHVPTSHDTVSQRITHKPQNVTQSSGDSLKVSSTDSMNRPVSGHSHQHQQTNSKDEYVQTISVESSAVPSTTSSSTEEPHQIMLRYNDKLITALSLDPQGISRTYRGTNATKFYFV